MASISHPNLAAVYDWGEEQIGKRGTVYVVGEYLSGGSLRDLFDRGRHLTPSQALMVGLEACRGLDFAHRKGLVHTELTPSKLVFGDDRRLRIVDFGLARILGEEEWNEPSRVATHVARYASPEQAEGKPLDGNTDVYSLALILVEAVTGRVPFDGDSTVATLSARIGKLMPVSADLGPLAAVLERAGRPEAAERSSASQFGRALVRAADKLPRPTPIPILASSLFEDPAAMRAPNDPTGGIARPPAVPSRRSFRRRDPGVAHRRDRRDRWPAEGGQQPRRAGGRRRPWPRTASRQRHADASSHGDLAALVETHAAAAGSRPESPAPTAPARRGGGVQPSEPRGSAKPDTKQSRRARKKEAKARLKAAKAGGARQATTGSGDRRPRRRPVAPRRRRPAPQPKRRRGFPGSLGLFLLAVLGGLGYLAWMLFRTPTHEIPAVVGLPQEEALALVDDFEWDITVDDGRSDEYRTPGQVIRTSPSAGEDLAEGSPLLLVVSEGPEFRSVPDLTGLTLADARSRDRAARARRRASRPPSTARTCRPARSSRRASRACRSAATCCPGAEVDLVVSDGPQPRRVPQLRGLTADEATQLLGDLGLVLAVGEQVFDDEVPAGEIATQNPAVDTTLDRGGTITANVSKGPDLVTFPDLTGMTLPQIGQALTDAGLRVGNLLGLDAGHVRGGVDRRRRGRRRRPGPPQLGRQPHHPRLTLSWHALRLPAADSAIDAALRAQWDHSTGASRSSPARAAASGAAHALLFAAKGTVVVNDTAVRRRDDGREATVPGRGGRRRDPRRRRRGDRR